MTKGTIKLHKQKKPYDSGQMCLAMLGYDWKEIMRIRDNGATIERELLYSDLANIKDAGTMGQTKTGKPVTYNEPFMWGFMPKNDELYQGLAALVNDHTPENGSNPKRENLHWVVRHRDLVHCPLKGPVNAKDYEDKYIRLILYQFRVPILKK